MQIKYLLLIFPALLLSACAHYHPEFENPKTPEGMKCKFEATKGAAAVQASGTSGINFDQIFKEWELFSLCMKSEQAKKGFIEPSKQDVNRMKAYQQETEDENNEMKQFCLRDEFKNYMAKTACFTNEITFEQMSDTSYLNKSDKSMFLKMRKHAQAYNKKQNDRLRNWNTPQAIKVANDNVPFLFEQEKNDLNLYTGKITWGEYNTRRKEIVNEAMKARK